MEGKIFVEKAWYITPPILPDTATEEEVIALAAGTLEGDIGT